VKKIINQTMLFVETEKFDVKTKNLKPKRIFTIYDFRFTILDLADASKNGKKTTKFSTQMMRIIMICAD
jgi:hypothetical protein